MARIRGFVLCWLMLLAPLPMSAQATRPGPAAEASPVPERFDRPAAVVRLQIAAASLGQQSPRTGLSRIKWYWRVLAVSVLILVLIAANWK